MQKGYATGSSKRKVRQKKKRGLWVPVLDKICNNKFIKKSQKCRMNFILFFYIHARYHHSKPKILYNYNFCILRYYKCYFCPLAPTKSGFKFRTKIFSNKKYNIYALWKQYTDLVNSRTNVRLFRKTFSFYASCESSRELFMVQISNLNQMLLL